MTDSIGGLPFWEVTFDADGDPDSAPRDTMLAEAHDQGISDLVVLAHGWNNDRATARRLYDGFFSLLAGQVPPKRRGTVGLVGVLWPSQRWSDEPIPDFTPAPALIATEGAARFDSQPAGRTLEPTLDPDTLAGLHAQFPAASSTIDRMAELLRGVPTDQAQAEFLRLLTEFSARAAARTAGEDAHDGDGAGASPGMLEDDPTTLFLRFRDALRAEGADLATAADSDPNAAALGDPLGGIWHGAKEALRAASYWAMKNRAGIVGRAGLGPLLGLVHEMAPRPRVHLVGHSFGARLVSFALAGLSADGSPVGSLTLLQGAFSHFTFARPLPFDASRSGALAGMENRVAGPLTVCFSEHDSAVGTFYPLASIASGEDAAARPDLLYRWGGMGADGAQGVDALLDGIQPLGSTYRFRSGQFLNVDASEIVRVGGPPSGAHSDILHPELTWIVLTSGELT
jgi:hypothetical protein